MKPEKLTTYEQAEAAVEEARGRLQAAVDFYDEREPRSGSARRLTELRDNVAEWLEGN